jgi:hypothetical protein
LKALVLVFKQLSQNADFETVGNPGANALGGQAKRLVVTLRGAVSI